MRGVPALLEAHSVGVPPDRRVRVRRVRPPEQRLQLPAVLQLLHKVSVPDELMGTVDELGTDTAG